MLGGRGKNYKQTSIDKGFLNLPYKRNRGRPGRTVRCQSNIVIYS